MTSDAGPKVTIGELSRHLGLTTRTLRFYDELGLVAAERDASNRRIYDLTAARELEVVERLRQAGLALAEIRCALVSGRVQGPTTFRVLALQSLKLRQAAIEREAQAVAEATAWLEGRVDIRRAPPDPTRLARRKGTGAALRRSHVR